MKQSMRNQHMQDLDQERKRNNNYQQHNFQLEHSNQSIREDLNKKTSLLAEKDSRMHHLERLSLGLNNLCKSMLEEVGKSADQEKVSEFKSRFTDYDV